MNSKKTGVDKQRNNFSAETWILLIGMLGFLAFLWIMAFMFIPLLSGQQGPVAIPQIIVQAAATQGIIFPPTWTPTPGSKLIPTQTATPVFNGARPTPMYTPRPTSLALGDLPFPMPNLPPPEDVIDLARILQGESTHDLEAAYYVGWVAKNRWLHSGYGDTYALVSSGFFGYRAGLQPKEEFIELAKQVINAKEDPTGGCLYALSRTDINKLGVPASRADVTIGEWFFFKSWPVTRYS